MPKLLHPLDDPKVVQQVLVGLDRVLAELRDVRGTIEAKKTPTTKGGDDA